MELIGVQRDFGSHKKKGGKRGKKKDITVLGRRKRGKNKEERQEEITEKSVEGEKKR